MRFGIIGTADIATDHVVPALRASEHEAAAIASRDADRAASVADEFGIERSYGSYEELLADGSLDAVYNPLPNALHAEWTRKAADEGLHVLCEKPLTGDAEAAAALFDYCEARDVTLMEGFMYRFHPRTERALEIAAEELGEVRHLSATFTFAMGEDPDDIRLDPDLAGGALMDVGSYAVHAARGFLGEPERAYAHFADSYDAGVDSQVAGTLAYPDGVTAHVTGSFESPYSERYRVLTTDGWLEADQCFAAAATDAPSLTWAVDGEEHTETFDDVDHYRLEVEGFADAVAGGHEQPISRADTVGNVRAIDALYESAGRDRPVDVGGTE